MSDDAVNYLIKAASGDRGPGKRVVKPSAALLDIALPEDDDSDEDFDAGGRSDGSSGSDQDESDSDQEGSENGSGDDSGEEGDASDNETTKTEEGKESLEESNLSVPGDTTAAVDRPGLVCCLCLNLRPTVQDDEVIQCDKCGLAVHENCYMVGDTEEQEDSDDSSSATEPWFCEPCVYGLDLPPNCELCPNRFGAFKRSDIGGKWVHLLCALYTRGVTFGEINRLTAVSWQELDYRLFGKKACSLCDDKLLARTGVCCQCDAGLCKTYFHVTCAQKYGLLVDNSEMEPDESHSTTVRGMNKVTVDPRFTNCKRHSNDDIMRTKRKAFLQLERQEDRRMLAIRRKALTDREERKRRKAFLKHEKMFKDLEGVTIFWPEKEQKRPRAIHTSAEYLDAFLEKAETNGQSRDDFEKEFRAIKVDQLPSLPAAFSAEFVGYYKIRESKHIPHEEKRLETLTASHQKLKNEQTKLQEKYKKLEVDHKKSHSDLVESHNALTAIFTAVSALGCKNVEKPKALKPPVVNKPRAINGMSKLSPQKAGPSGTGGHQPMRLKMCAQCLKSTDQHLLAHCDTCLKDFHLACLDPPLTRMPKKTAQYGWECSKCFEDSESDDKSVELGVPSADETEDGPRKLRQRSSLSKPKRAADEIALDNAIAATFKKKRGRPPKKSQSSVADSSIDSSPGAKRSKPPKLTKYHEEDVDMDTTADLTAGSDGPHELVDEKIVTVKTTKEPKFRRMQYPTTRLQDAVTSVLKGRMNIKQAAERFNVPRSTVQRRITLSREEHKRRASSMGGSDQDQKTVKSELNGSGDLADENIDVENPATPQSSTKDGEVDIDSVSDNCSDSTKLVRRRRRKGAEVIVVEDLNLA